MKRLFIAVFAGVLIIGPVTIASAAPSVLANIPFAFHAGDALLPAGEYIVTLGYKYSLGSNIIIQARDGSESYFVPFLPGEERHKDNHCSLTFTKYGNAYFMSKVQAGMIEVTTSKSRAERKTAGLQGKKVPVVASSMK